MREEKIVEKRKKDDIDKMNIIVKTNELNKNNIINQELITGTEHKNLEKFKERNSLAFADSINLDEDLKLNIEIKGNKASKDINIFNNNFKSNFIKEEVDIITNLLHKKIKMNTNLERLIKKNDMIVHNYQNEIIEPENKLSMKEIEPINTENPWITENLFVRIKDKELKNGEYFNKKGKIINVSNDFLAEIELVEGKNKIRIDQIMLEPIIPALTSNVSILCGKFKGRIGKLVEINIKGKYLNVEIDDESFLISIGGICKI